jgi:hypothetical protein
VRFHQLGKEYHGKMLTPAATKALLRPYITELGYLAAAWNQLQHNLSSLFTLLVASGKDPIGQAVWHAAESDFVQRKMLRAFVEIDQTLLPAQRALLELQAREILWILDQIDRNLRHKRNNAIHAPLMTITGVWDGAVRHRVEAHFNPHNPRAKPLRGKNLKDEFKDYPRTPTCFLATLREFGSHCATPHTLHGQIGRPCHKLTKRNGCLVKASGDGFRACLGASRA